MRTNSHTVRTSALTLAALAALATAGRAGDDLPLNLTALAVNMSNVGRQGAQTLQITIERWTTEEELAKLKAALVEKGSDSLIRSLQDIKPRAGYIRAATGGLGWDIGYAAQTELPGGGRRIVIATDRPMSFAERASSPRSAEYDFLLAEMHIAAGGTGQGKLVPMAKVTYNEVRKTIEVENYATEPVRLTEIKIEKKKEKS
jgi:hypothetical protein